MKFGIVKDFEAVNQALLDQMLEMKGNRRGSLEETADFEADVGATIAAEALLPDEDPRVYVRGYEVSEAEIPTLKDSRVRADAKLAFAKIKEEERLKAGTPPKEPRCDILQVQRSCVAFREKGAPVTAHEALQKMQTFNRSRSAVALTEAHEERLERMEKAKAAAKHGLRPMSSPALRNMESVTGRRGGAFESLPTTKTE